MYDNDVYRIHHYIYIYTHHWSSMYVLCKSSEIWLLFRNSWISSGKTCFKPLDLPPESKPLAHPWHLCLELQETAQVLPKFKGTIWSHKRFCMANIEVGTKASLLFMAVVPHLLIWGEPRFWWAIYRHNPTHSRTWPNDSFQSGTRWVEHQPLRGQSSSFPNEEFSRRMTASCNGRSCLDQKSSLSRNALQGGWKKRGMGKKSRAKATVHSSVNIFSYITIK